MKKQLLLVAIGISFIFLFSCSASKDKFWDRSTKKEVSEFMSHVRPSSGNSDSHYLLALYYQERGLHREAVNEFRKTIAICPDHFKAYNGLGISYDNLGDFTRAEEAYLIALTLCPESGLIRNNLGYSYLLQKKFSDSIIILEEAHKRERGNRIILQNLGIVYYMAGQFEKAVQTLKAEGNDVFSSRFMAQVQHHNSLMEPSRTDRDSTDELNRSSEIAAQESEVLPHPTQVQEKRNMTCPVPSDGIEISNGNGVRHMARDTGLYLKRKGFRVMRYSNASHFRHRTPRIFYTGDRLGLAEKIAEMFPCEMEIQKISSLDRPDITLRVLLGTDLIPHRKRFTGGQG